jgi:hypothetical protein
MSARRIAQSDDEGATSNLPSTQKQDSQVVRVNGKGIERFVRRVVYEDLMTKIEMHSNRLKDLTFNT